MEAAPTRRGRGRGRGRGPGSRIGLDSNPLSSGPARNALDVNGGTTAPAGGRGAGRPKGSIGEGSLVGPGGRQLQAKVQSGSITSAQAKRTLGQRQTLAKALGPDWRDKLMVGGRSFAQVNKQLKANPGNAKLAAIRKKLVANRSTVLAAARAKNKAGAADQEEEG
jgi:hypothetical protein